MSARNWRRLNLAALLGLVPVGVTLWLWGQPLLSKSGDMLIWVNETWSEENSQQIADWYSLSHFIHGMLAALVGLWIGGRRGALWSLGIAVTTGIVWELVKHTDWVLERFRGQAIYQGYVGDTVLNACSDYLIMLAGFHLARTLGVAGTLGVILGLEVFSTVLARDSLTLTTIRVLHPIPALSDWQDAINPLKQKGDTATD